MIDLNKHEIAVRKITTLELHVVQQFLLQQCKELYGGEISANQYKDIENLDKNYIEPGRNAVFGAFTPAGKLTGTIAVSTYNDRIASLKGRYQLGTTAEIGRCYIDAQLRRQGIGSLLFNQAIAFCQEQGYQTLYLHTHRFLPGGFLFWEKQGFLITLDEDDSHETVHMEKILLVPYILGAKGEAIKKLTTNG